MRVQWEGYEAIKLQAGEYTAMALPELGAQVISLEKNGVPLLHAPENRQALQKASTSYGLPVLFPPNRIDGGHFQADGRSYSFPVNEAARANSLHGFLHTRPWQVQKVTDNILIMQYEATEQSDFYVYYPHAFKAEIQYILNEKGLHQQIMIENRSDRSMPVGLGFHSAFAVDEQSRIRLSAGKRILMNERMLPTGETRPLNDKEQCLRTEGLAADAWSMDDHYTAQPLDMGSADFHGAVIDRAVGHVFYEVDPFYQHWMIWNANRTGTFICLEPQNWRVNAPNLVAQGLSAHEAGFCMLESGKSLQAKARIWMETS